MAVDRTLERRRRSLLVDMDLWYRRVHTEKTREAFEDALYHIQSEAKQNWDLLRVAGCGEA